MRKSTIAIGVAAALSTQAFVGSTNADAAVKVKPQKASGPIHSQPHFKYPNHVRPNGSTVLYDQTGTGVNGAPSQNFESSFDAYDTQGADDFVVTDASGWTISAFNFVVSATGDPSSATYDIEVFPDDRGVPGASPVCSYPAAAGVLTNGNTALSVALPSPCSLAQGTYWVEMVVNLDIAVGGQMFWSDFSPAGTGANSKWQNPNDGFGTGCTTWSDLASCAVSGSPVGGGQTAFMFQVVGAIGGGSGCGAGQLCLVSTVSTDTTPRSCGTDDTIDATVGDQINFCYTITNNTGVELDYHTLQNNIDGTLLSLLNEPVRAGGTFQFNRIETVSTTNTYNSTWTALDGPPGYGSEVESSTDCADIIFADGFDGSNPACGGSNFVDITGTGTPLNIFEDLAIQVTMPFSFNFYGTTSNQICVDDNGFLLFNTTDCPFSGLFNNQSLPSASFSAPAILPLWDDFTSAQGNVYTDTRGTAPNRQFIVEWSDRVHSAGSVSNTDGATFEVILNEDGTIQFEYADASYTGEGGDCSGGLCATIGLQNDATLFNQFSSSSAAVTDNSGIKWTPTAPQVFTSSDSVTVNVGQPTIVVNDGNPITGTVPAGGSSDIPFNVSNIGNRDLNWSLTEAGPANLHFPPPGTRFAMPLGNPARDSSAPAPIALRHPGQIKPSRHAIHVPTAGATVFAADIYQSIFETFDVTDPAGATPVAPSDPTPWTGGAFIDCDFSKMYVIAGNFANNPDTFATVDTTTGATNVIGTPGNNLGEGWQGMAYDSTTGTLFGLSSSCGTSSHLWTIDPNTGNSTLVGQLTNENCAIAIAIDGNGNMYGLDVHTDSLYAIDKTTGDDAQIGSVGFDMNYAQDMAFDAATGILYLAGFDGSAFTDDLYTLDLATGLATVVGPIGSSFGEVDAMGIETCGGPCSQPVDLPWLSLSSLRGTTAPGDSTPITASIDGTGTSDGDTLAGTVCAASNDPANHSVATPITVTVGAGSSTIVDSGLLNYTVNPDNGGLSINWLTGDWCSSNGGPCDGSGGYDFNPFFSLLLFIWPGAGNCVASDSTECDILGSGATIGPASTFAFGDSANYIAGNTTGYLGFSFVNANTLQVNYGYALFTTTAGTGYPATLVEYWYDNSGAPITIP